MFKNLKLIETLNQKKWKKFYNLKTINQKN